MPVITDASSAILLEKAGFFSMTAQFLSLILPVSVFKEISKPGRDGADYFIRFHTRGRFTVRPADFSAKTYLSVSGLNLGKGETEMIALYLERFHNQTDGSFILTDDGKAARWCYKENLPFINALLVPKIFWYAGFIKKETCLSQMGEICRIGRYSQKIKDFAFGCDAVDLSYFIPIGKTRD